MSFHSSTPSRIQLLLVVNGLLTISNTITAKGLCTGTRKQYSGHVQAYQYWYDSKAIPYPILPLNADAVRAWLTDIHLEKPDLQWKSYCTWVTSLRAWSRDTNRDWPVNQLDYDWDNNRTQFADFIRSLKKNIPDKPLKQAEAVDSGLMTGVIQHILNTETNLFLRERDVVLFSGGFLKGLRASDLRSS